MDSHSHVGLFCKTHGLKIAMYSLITLFIFGLFFMWIVYGVILYFYTQDLNTTIRILGFVCLPIFWIGYITGRFVMKFNMDSIIEKKDKLINEERELINRLQAADEIYDTDSDTEVTIPPSIAQEVRLH